MNGLPPALQRLISTFAALGGPAPVILLPGIMALSLWTLVPMIWTNAPVQLVFTICVVGSYVTLLARRAVVGALTGASIMSRPFALGILFALVAVQITVLLGFQSIRICQHFISLHFAAIAAVHLLQLREPADADTQQFWGKLDRPHLHLGFSAGTVFLALSALFLNEVIMRVATPEDWLLIWAISPVVLHYANTMMLQIVLIRDRLDGA